MVITTDNKELIAFANTVTDSTMVFDNTTSAYSYMRAAEIVSSYIYTSNMNMPFSSYSLLNTIVANSINDYLTYNNTTNSAEIKDIALDVCKRETAINKASDIYEINNILRLINNAVSLGAIGTVENGDLIICLCGYENVVLYSPLYSAADTFLWNDKQELIDSTKKFILYQQATDVNNIKKPTIQEFTEFVKYVFLTNSF